jgi:alpha-tubulin suppressor-like RCC1 family protein
VWGWGHDVSENSQEPMLVKSLALHRALNNVRFVHVSGGGDFSLAVTEHGSVWSFGGNAGMY